MLLYSISAGCLLAQDFLELFPLLVGHVHGNMSVSYDQVRSVGTSVQNHFFVRFPSFLHDRICVLTYSLQL